MWRDYCFYRRLPRELRRRVMAYINTSHSNKRVLDDLAMLAELGPGLRTDVNMHLCAELVATVPIFIECSPIVVRAMVSKLQRETHIEGDYVFRWGPLGGGGGGGRRAGGRWRGMDVGGWVGRGGWVGGWGLCRMWMEACERAGIWNPPPRVCTAEPPSASELPISFFTPPPLDLHTHTLCVFVLFALLPKPASRACMC